MTEHHQSILLHPFAYIIPAYNDAHTIKQVLQEVDTYLAEHIPQACIVIVDNCSTDHTYEVAKEIASMHQGHCPVYIYQSLSGRGAAIQEAVKQVPALVYMYMDSDMPFTLAHIKPALEQVRQGEIDMGVGKRDRVYEESLPWIRRLATPILQICTRLLVGTLPVTHVQCGFKIWNQSVAENILPLCTEQGFFLDIELVVHAYKKGYKVADIEVITSPGTQTLTIKRSHVHVMRDTIAALRVLARIGTKYR